MEKNGIKNSTLVLIVAPPGRMRDSLRALLRAAPHIETVEQVDDSSAGLMAITQHQPALVVLDTDLLDDEVQTMVRQIKTQSPQTPGIVLANTVRQQQMARAAGADAALLKGFPAAQLFAAIDKLLSRAGTTSR